MTRGEKLAYCRGYSAGRNGRWPLGLPDPPSQIVRDLVRAVEDVIGNIDILYATTFSSDTKESDEFGLLSSRDRLEDALESIEQWLTVPEPSLSVPEPPNTNGAKSSE